MVTRSNGMGVFYEMAYRFFPRFLIGATAVLRNGIQNFILSPTVCVCFETNCLEFTFNSTKAANNLFFVQKNFIKNYLPFFF